MSNKRKTKKIHCAYFAWTFSKRKGIWQADGRSNELNVGRHSLGTRDEDEARILLVELDRTRAEDLGLAPKSKAQLDGITSLLLLADGRKFYENHLSRPRVAGGVKPKTFKKYRSVFDKFIAFLESQGIGTWNAINSQVVNNYLQDLETKEYAHKSQKNELTTIKQTVKWLIEEGHLVGVTPINIKTKSVESKPAYCYRQEELEAMVSHCQNAGELEWLENLIIALACTGLRISELVELRWSDIDLESDNLILTDESGYSDNQTMRRRTLKNGRSRSFPIHADLATVLDRIQRVDQYIFHGPRGGRLKPDTARRCFVRDIIKPLTSRFPSDGSTTSFEDGRFHSFRHYFCSTCANNNVPERVLMQWLGHSSSEMIKIYYHLHNEESRRQMNKINFLGDAGSRSSGDRVVFFKEDVE